MRLRERFAARRARHLAVQRHHVAAPVPEGGERLAVGLAGGDLRSDVPARQVFLSADPETMRPAHRPGSHDVNPQALAASLGNHSPGIVRWPAAVARPAAAAVTPRLARVRAKITVGRPVLAAACR